MSGLHGCYVKSRPEQSKALFRGRARNWQELLLIDKILCDPIHLILQEIWWHSLLRVVQDFVPSTVYGLRILHFRRLVGPGEI